MQDWDLTEKIHLHLFNLDKSEDMSDWLSVAERERAEKMPVKKFQQRFINGRGYLRFCLSHYVRQDLHQTELTEGEKGKLYLADTDLFFNLAHTDYMAIFAFNLNNEIGVDIEKQRPMRNLQAIAKRVFTPVELEYLQSANNQENAFFTLWTRKEAVIKASGKGITSNLQSITTTLANGEIAESIPHIDDLGLSLQDLDVAAPCCAALVADFRGKELQWFGKDSSVISKKNTESSTS